MRVRLYMKALAIELLDDYVPAGINYSAEERKSLKAERRGLKISLSQMGMNETKNLNSVIWRVKERHEEYFEKNYVDIGSAANKVEEILKTHNKLFGWKVLD